MNKRKVAIILLSLIILSTLSHYSINMMLTKPIFELKTLDLEIEPPPERYIGFYTHIQDFAWSDNILAVLLSNGTMLLINEDLQIFNRFQNVWSYSLKWLDQTSIVLSSVHTISIFETVLGIVNPIANSTDKFFGIHVTQDKQILALSINNNTLSIYSITPELLVIDTIDIPFMICDIKWSVDGNFLFLTDFSGSLYKWSPENQLELIFKFSDEDWIIWRIQPHSENELIMLYSMYMYETPQIYSYNYIKNKIIGKIDVSPSGNIEWMGLGNNIISACYLGSATIGIYDLNQETQLFNVTVESRIYNIQTSPNALLAYTANQIIHKWEFAGTYLLLFELRDYRLSYLIILAIIPKLLTRRKKHDANPPTYPKV